MSSVRNLSIWADVLVDPEASADLVHQLVATARALGEAVGVLDGDGPVIADDWGGPHRDAFDVDRQGLSASAQALVEALLGAAVEVQAVTASGLGEQRLRERLREESRREALAAAAVRCEAGVAC